MENDRFLPDKLDKPVYNWFDLIDQARRASEGALVPTFLEIANQIASELHELLKNELKLRSIKTIFVGISVISYLNERYAIEKVMMFAKGRCRVSLATPPELISQLIGVFSDRLEFSSLDEWTKTVGTVMLFMLNKDFRGAGDAVSSLKDKFKERLNDKNLSIIEGILYALTRNDLIPIIISTLNENQTDFADDPFYLYFSILKNLVSEIQAIQSQRKSRLQGLWNLFDKLSELE